MTRPKPRRATVTVKSVRSEESFLAIPPPLQPRDFLLEGPAAMGIVLEHVEGGAGGGEEHGVAREGGGPGPLHRFPEGGAAVHGQDALEALGDTLLGLADRQHALAALAQQGREASEVAALVAAAQDQEGRPREGQEALASRLQVRS